MEGDMNFRLFNWLLCFSVIFTLCNIETGYSKGFKFKKGGMFGSKKGKKSSKGDPKEKGFNTKKKYSECDTDRRNVANYRTCKKVSGTCKKWQKCPSGKCAKKGKGGACAPLKEEDTSPVKFCQYNKSGFGEWSECAHKAANGNSCKKWKQYLCPSGDCKNKISDSSKLGWSRNKPGIFKKCTDPEPNMSKYNTCSKGNLNRCVVAKKGGSKCRKYEKNSCGTSETPGCCKDSKSCLVPSHPKCSRGKPNCCVNGISYWMECKKQKSRKCDCGCQGSKCKPVKIDVDPDADSDRGEDYIKGYGC